MNILKSKTDERQRQFDIERDRLHEQTKSLEKTRDELTKENNHLNSTLKHVNDCQNELEREKDKNRELYKKSIQLESQLSSTNGIEVRISICLPTPHRCIFLFQQELTEINLKLKNELNQLINESHSNKQELHQVNQIIPLQMERFSFFFQMNNQCTTTIENARRAFFSERKEMESKIEQLVEQLKKYKTKMIEAQREKKESRAKYHNFSQKLIEKSQLIEAKLNEIKQKELSLQ